MKQYALNGLKGAFILITIWSLGCANSGAQVSENVAENVTAIQDGKVQPNSTQDASLTSKNVSGPALLTEVADSKGTIDGEPVNNSTLKKAEINLTNSNPKLELKVDKPHSKRETENETINEFKPFLLFPTFPFLFPKDGESSNLKDEFPPGKVEEPKEKGKPFIFFKFAFDIRQIPLENGTDNSNDSKIINVKKLSFEETPLENLDTKDLPSGTSQRDMKVKKDINRFFDDFSLFPDTDIDEFFPKPDLFFPDLLFHRKPLRKLSRRKRAMKKPEIQNDFKFFIDMFDEAFMKTKRELEQTNPILDFLRVGDPMMPLKKSEDLMLGEGSPEMSSDSKPVAKWKSRRNVKRPSTQFEDKNNRPNSMVFLDKVFKAGKIQMHDSLIPEKSIKNIRDANESKNKKITQTEDESKDGEPRDQDLLSVKKEKINDSLRKKRNFDGLLSVKRAPVDSPREKNEISPAKGNDSLTEKSDSTKVPAKVVTLIHKVVNSTENILSYAGDLIKVMDSLEAKFKGKMAEKRNGSSPGNDAGKTVEKNLLYDDLEKNITKVLTQFLSLFSKMDDAKFELSEHDSFDWTENETLQNANVFGKRSKKNADFVEEYADKEKKEVQVADLNYLFLTVTLPTIIVSALLLLVCFFNLQVKGKICSKLFKPRHVYVIEDESHYAVPKSDKSPKVQEF